MSDDDHGLDEDEVFEALGELYREGKVDMEPAVGNVDARKRKFSLTEKGFAGVRETFEESDAAVLYLVGLVLEEQRPFESEEDLGSALLKFSNWFADETGINAIRIINRNVDDVPYIREPLPESVAEPFDREGDDD